MRYLVDGYNLAHAMSLLSSKALRPHQLENARQALLLRLCQGHGAETASVTVVFDAAGGAHRRAQAQQVFQGVRILFAQSQSADDLIEDIIQRDKAPRQLAVVSDDRRLRESARRRGCVALGCLDYLEGLDRPARPPPLALAPEALKPIRNTEEERRHWMEAFGDIDRDPQFRDELNIRFPGLDEEM